MLIASLMFTNRALIASEFQAQMVRRVRAYLQNLPVEEDEVKMTEWSNACEPPQAGNV
jgi:hypothetical protein